MSVCLCSGDAVGPSLKMVLRSKFQGEKINCVGQLAGNFFFINCYTIEDDSNDI